MAWVEDTNRRSAKAKFYTDSLIATKHRVISTIHDQHYHDGAAWQEVNESLIDETGEFAKQCNTMAHAIHIGNGGNRRWYPRRNVATEYVNITNIQYWREAGGGSWRNINLPTPVWRNNGADWDMANLYTAITIGWHRIKSQFTLKDNTAPTRLRFQVDLVGLTLDTDTWKLTSIADNVVVGSIDPPKAWYGNAIPQKATALPVSVLYSGGYIEWSIDTTGATFPVYVDPTLSTDSTTADAYIYGSDASFAAARSTATNYSPSENIMMVGATQYGGYYVNRAFLKFDTSTIPDDATVTQVNITMVVTIDDSAEDFDVQIVKANWSVDEPLVDHMDAGFDLVLSADADSSIWRNTSGMSINTTYTSGNLSTAWINLTGYTYYGLRSSEDYNNSQPTGLSEISIAAAEHATTSYRPQIDVQYDEAGGAFTVSKSESSSLSESKTVETSAPQISKSETTGATTEAITAQLTSFISSSDSTGATAETVTASVSAPQVSGSETTGATTESVTVAIIDALQINVSDTTGVTSDTPTMTLIAGSVTVSDSTGPITETVTVIIASALLVSPVENASISEQITAEVNPTEINTSDSLGATDTVIDLDIITQEGEILGIAITPDSVWAQGVRIVG